ncbi:AIR synthase related protein, partial [Bordetella pertussis]|uniref:AIR synthase related protein n=1 Tax=Bordetella pertussis TaxID=520 RepID=UPI0021CC2758
MLAGVALASEFDLIARYFTRPAPDGVLGVGDDCALFPVPPGQQVATSTDLLIEGRHFFPDVDPQALGHKALAVNLSDLAAMGARPVGCLLGLALPGVDEAWLAAFARTVFGAVAPGHALRRAAAQPGDDVWVSGEL